MICTSMTESEYTSQPFTEILTKERSAILDRARERGAAMQKYLVVINGSGLIAAFSLAGVFVGARLSPDIFTWPALLFAAGMVASGIALLRAILLQHRTMDKIDELVECLEGSKLTENAAKNEWGEHKLSSRDSAKLNYKIQFVGFLFFVIGIGIGIYKLNQITLPNCPPTVISENKNSGLVLPASGSHLTEESV